MKLASGDGKAREGHFPLAVGSPECVSYVTDMNFCLAFALENRKQIAEGVVRSIQEVLEPKGISVYMSHGLVINRNHNHAEHVDTPNAYPDGMWIHRKGATHAEQGMLGVVPGNMKDGSFIVAGKGNIDSLCSSSHGAGRIMGRKEAKRTLSLDVLKSGMKGIAARITPEMLDESFQAYKDINEVMRLQRELVDVVGYVCPLINVKG